MYSSPFEEAASFSIEVVTVSGGTTLRQGSRVTLGTMGGSHFGSG